MSKYERRVFFDRLVELRETYQRTEHEATSTSVEQAIADAIDLLDDPERLDAILVDGSTDSAPTVHTV